MGTIVKIDTKQGVRYKAEVYVKGKRASKRHASRRAANHWIAEQEQTLAVVNGVPVHMRLSDAIVRYANEIAPTKKGVKWDVARCNKLLRYPIADRPLAELSLADAEDHMELLRREQLVNDSIIREMTLLKVIVRQCRRWYQLVYPWQDLKMPKAGQARDRLITDAEVNLILHTANYDPQYTPTEPGQLAGAMFLFAIETGMRQGEIAGLTPAMLDPQKQVALLPKGLCKNGYSRKVPLSVTAMRIIDSLPDCAWDTPMFQTTAMNCSALFRLLRKRAGLPDAKQGGFRFHDTRHLACTRLAKKPKMTALNLARMIGHRDVNELLTYFNPSAEDMVESICDGHDPRDQNQSQIDQLIAENARLTQQLSTVLDLLRERS